MDEDDARELQRLGVPAEQIEAQRAQQAPHELQQETFRLAAHLWPSLQLFGLLDTQWWTVPGPTGPVRTGLMYEAIRTTARLAGHQVDKAVFKHLRVLESETLKLQAGAIK